MVSVMFLLFVATGLQLWNSIKDIKVNYFASDYWKSYKEFINAIETMFEVAVLGQAGTTRNDSVGSFAKAQTMNLTTEDIKWTDINYAEELVNMYISKVLPLLTSSIKPENIEFSFIRDENQDILTFSQLLNTLSNLQVRTLTDRKGLALSVREVFKGLGMQADTDYYKDNDMFVFGDNDGQFLADEVNREMYGKGKEE